MHRLVVLVILVGAVQSEKRSERIRTRVQDSPVIQVPQNKYYEALQNYSKLHKYLLADVVNDSNRLPFQHNFRLAYGILDGLISALASRPNTNYDDVYESLVPRLFNAALNNTDILKRRLACVNQDVDQQTKKLRDAISKNKNLQKICENKNSMQCDMIIEAIIQTADVEDLAKEGERVLALGDLSSVIFGNGYELEEKTVGSVWDTYSYLLGAKDKLKPLVEAGVKVRAVLGENCAAFMLPAERYSPMRRSMNID